MSYRNTETVNECEVEAKTKAIEPVQWQIYCVEILPPPNLQSKKV